MTNKIKSAREEMPEGRNHGDLIRWLDRHQKTILEALSAYEKLQGVDGMKRKVPYVYGQSKLEVRLNGEVIGYNQAIDDIKARIVADIGKDR